MKLPTIYLAEAIIKFYMVDRIPYGKQLTGEADKAWNNLPVIVTYRVGCSVRQGKEASIPLNSCEKSGIFTLGSSCTYRRCRKCKPDTIDLRRMALEKLQEKREQTLGIIIYQLELTRLFCLTQ